jgi:uncharacterized protein
VKKSTLEENKEIAFEWLEAFAQCDVERMKAISGDSFKYYLGGELPPSGIIPGKEFFAMLEEAAQPILHPITIRVGAVTAEENRVCIEGESEADLANGNKYNNWYHFLIIVDDGRVSGVKEYADSLHVAQVLFGATTGLPARARASVLGPVTRTIVTRAET